MMGSLETLLIASLPVSLAGELLTTRMHFFTGWVAQLDTKVSFGVCIMVHILSPMKTPKTTTKKEISMHDFIAFESNMIFSCVFILFSVKEYILCCTCVLNIKVPNEPDYIIQIIMFSFESVCMSLYW